MEKASSRPRRPRMKAQERVPMRKRSGRRSAPRGEEKAESKWVYSFGSGKAEGGAEMRDLLGGKGAGLAEMANLGLPVPPGFTITTEVCRYYYENGKSYPPDLKEQVETALACIGKLIGKGFGDRDTPLLVS